MKLHQALLLLLAVAHACHAQCPQFPGFVFIENMDSHGYDIPEQPSQPNPVPGDPEDAFGECDDNDDCKAFNTNGWMKHTVVPLTSVYYGYDCGGVYIKCYDNWDDFVGDAEKDCCGISGNPTPYFLCSGTHTAAFGLHLNDNFVTIGCSDPVSGCNVDGSVHGSTNQEAIHNEEGGAVILSDLTLQGFRKAVWQDNAEGGGTITLDRCNITNNEVGLDWPTGNVIVTNSTFEKNDKGAVVVSEECTATISGSTFSDNKADSGGALHCFGSDTSCTVENSVFVGNKAAKPASGKGGAVYCADGATCGIDLETCSFQGNVAAHGKDIYFDSSLTCSFSD